MNGRLVAAEAPYRIHRLPVDLIDRVTLADGRELIVRPVLPQDAEATQDFVRALSRTSRYRRFHAGLPMLPAPLLEGLTQVDHDRHVALVAQTVDDTPVLVAEARYVRRDDEPVAEFALVVADDWQGQGLGRMLLERLGRHAARHGVLRLEGDVLHDNAPLFALVEHFGGRITSPPGGHGVLRATFAA